MFNGTNQLVSGSSPPNKFQSSFLEENEVDEFDELNSMHQRRPLVNFYTNTVLFFLMKMIC